MFNDRFFRILLSLISFRFFSVRDGGAGLQASFFHMQLVSSMQVMQSAPLLSQMHSGEHDPAVHDDLDRLQLAVDTMSLAALPAAALKWHPPLPPYCTKRPGMLTLLKQIWTLITSQFAGVCCIKRSVSKRITA